MRGYQSLQKDSQSLQNPAELRVYWNFAERKIATEKIFSVAKRFKVSVL